MKKLPPDHPLFKRGFIVGQTFSGASPKDVRTKPNATRLESKERSSASPMSEERIRGLEGKPKGSA